MSTWHPLLAAVESPPGMWRMVDPGGRDYGTVEIRRTVDGIRYRATHRGPAGARVIGWSTSLKLACEKVHGAYLQAHGPASAPNEGWPAHPAHRP